MSLLIIIIIIIISFFSVLYISVYMSCLVVIFINYSASLLRDRLKILSFTTSAGHLNVVKCPGYFFFCF